MEHKYLTDIGIKEDDMPWNWNPDDIRQKEWVKEREKYGFDERETWDLDYSFHLWFYERLMMYNEINCIDTSYHKFKYKNEELTLQECIDFILETLKNKLLRDIIDWDKKTSDKIYKQEEKMYQLIIKILPCLWW